MTLTLRYAARSDRGLIRGGNQDSVYAGPRLLAVADGMGGMAAGDVASNIVIAAMAPLDEDVPGNALVDALRGAVETANQQIRDAVDANPAMEGMGTTLTALLFSGTRFGMVHIGDSRAYLLREGEFVQVTKDDTYVQMLVDEGQITEEEASSHPQRSLLTRALQGSDADPEYSVRQAVPGDRYLLCSDGLSGVVHAETIEATLREYTDPQEAAERLIQLALRGGGPDNITVIVADVTDGNIVEEAPIVGGAAARDRGNTTSADQSTPAARAQQYAAPRPPAPEPPPGDADVDNDRPKRRPFLTAGLLVVLLGLLGGGLWYGWNYTQQQYYVGATDKGTVAIFRGVQGDVAGLHLSTVYEESDTKLDDLTEVAQNTVKQGIPAKNEDDARRKIADLTRDQKVCPPSDPSATPSTTPSSAPVLSTAPSQPGVLPSTAGVPGASATPGQSVGLTPTPTAAPADPLPSDGTDRPC